jgi:hypothetical protein
MIRALIGLTAVAALLGLLKFCLLPAAERVAMDHMQDLSKYLHPRIFP